MLNKSIITKYGVTAEYWKLRNVEVWPGRCIVYVDLYASRGFYDAGGQPFNTERFEFNDDLPIDIESSSTVAAIRNEMRKLAKFADATNED